jgi:type II secretory pathway component PulC
MRLRCVNGYRLVIAAALAGAAFLSPLWAQDIVESVRQEVGASGNVTQTPSPAPENNNEEEFFGFSDFFMPAFPRPEETPKVVTSELAEEENVGVALPAMDVTGIVWGTKQPRAIIDQKVYGEGDVVEGTQAEILKINSDGILFKVKTKEFLMKRSELQKSEG